MSASFADALALHPAPEPIDVARARAQHAAYVDALRRAGAEVHALPPIDALPDACFVEDTAIVACGRAVALVPGHPARRGEVASVADALATWLAVTPLAAGTVDGGDVLRVGRTLYVGRSSRTDGAGAAALAAAFPELEVVPVDVRDGLHLKSGATALPDGRILVAPARVDPGAFAEPVLPVPAEEPDAANVVYIGRRVLVASDAHRTSALLAELGYDVEPVDTSELRKADGALTCLSILVEPPSPVLTPPAPPQRRT